LFDIPIGEYNSLTLMTQTEFLQSAIAHLEMTRDDFAARLGCPRRTLDKWFLPETSNDHRTMPEVVWTLVREVLANRKLLAKVERLEKKVEKNAWPSPLGINNRSTDQRIGRGRTEEKWCVQAYR
jgi:hypothetical protein